MRLIDLSYSISSDMPVYPGTEPPLITSGCSIAENGFLEQKITLYSHTGTHMDAPAHLLDGAKTLDQFTLEKFYGNAFILHFTKAKNANIDLNMLLPYQDSIRNSDFLLFHSGWGRFWGTKQYFSDYPILSYEAAAWLTDFNLKGVGFDTISADAADSPDLPIHKVFLKRNLVIIENLANLDKLPGDRFVLSCFPLKFYQADGSPVRAVAIFN